MVTVLVVYHSQGGNTRKMAQAVAGGAASIEGVRAILKPAAEAGVEDLISCDGLALGSPEYFGYMAGMIKDFFDRTYEAARGREKVVRKPYVAFISAGNDGMGALTAMERICSGYPFKKVYEAVVVRGEVDTDALLRCEELGKTIAAGCEVGVY